MSDSIFIDGDFNDSYESRVRRAKGKKVFENDKFNVYEEGNYWNFKPKIMKDNLQTRLKEIEDIYEKASFLLMDIIHLKEELTVNTPHEVLGRLATLRDIAVDQAKEIELKKASLFECMSAISDLKSEIDRLTRFIPVGERVPDNNKKVKIEGTGVYREPIAEYNSLYGNWYDDLGDIVHGVTGWREI